MQNENKNLNTTEYRQEIILSGFMKSSYMLSLLKNELKENNFTDSTCRNIYRGLISYYKKYNKLPSLNELLVSIDENYIDLMDTSLDKCKSMAKILYQQEEPDEKFLFDESIELIRKDKVNNLLSKVLDKLKNGEKYDSEKFAKELSDAMNIKITNSELFNLSNEDELKEIRSKALGDGDFSNIIKSSIPGINDCLQYKGYQRGTLNLIVSPPGTGKSSFLVCEGSVAALANNRVLHVFLGDMVQYDGFIRYLSNISGIPQNDIIVMNLEKQTELVNKINKEHNNVLDRINILAYGSGEVDVDTLLESIKKEQERLGYNFDDIIIDYADNFSKDETKMYSEGGYIYDRLALFGRLNNSVMMVASQPKISYWNEEIIPLEGAAESSKKQHIVDLLLTFNLVSRKSKIGTIFVPKVRRGISGNLIRVETEWEKCRLHQITEDEYQEKKAVISGM